MTRAKSPIPQGFHTVTPQLIFDDTAQAIDWYERAFDAREVSRSKGPDGQIIHAEIQIGDSRIFLNDAMGGARSAKSLGGSPISLFVYVEDCDAVFDQAVAEGAKVDPGPMGKVSDQFWGDRVGMFTDPFGYRWSIATRIEDVPQKEMERRATDFFKSQPQTTHA